MKVIFVHDHIFYKFNNLYYSNGGLSNEILKRYTDIFENITVLSRQQECKIKNDKLSIATTAGVDFINIPNFKNATTFYKYFTAKRIIKKEIIKYDAVIIRLPSSAGLIALNFAKKNNIPYLIELVACQWDSFWYHSIIGKILAPISYLYLKNTILNSTAVVYITENFLQKRYPTNGKQYILPNVKLFSLNETVIENRLVKICNFSNSKNISITSIGATNMRYKGHDYMIKALSIIIKKGINVEYHIIGGGNNLRLQKISKKLGLQNHVIFHGPIPHEKISSVLDETDIYVQPSLAEAQGRSLIEAMSRGCPCVCTDVGGMPELIQKEFIAKRKNPISLADKIDLILKSDLKKIALRNFEFAKKFESTNLEIKRKQIFSEVFKF